MDEREQDQESPLLPIPEEFTDQDWLERIETAKKIRKALLESRDSPPPEVVPMRRYQPTAEA